MPDRTDAARTVLAENGDLTNEAVAEALKARSGMERKPGIVAVVRASFRWQELAASQRAMAERIAADLAENEAKDRAGAA